MMAGAYTPGSAGLETSRLKKLRMRVEVDGSWNGMKKLKMRGKELDRLPPEVFHLYELEILDLSPDRESCLFYKLHMVPPSISKLLNLRHLIMDTNELRELPSEISLLSSLERISLSNNKISTLPDSFQQLKKLVSLHFSNNRIERFPACICQLENLEFLDMCDNQISELPADIKNLKKLESFHLFQNKLKEIPVSICGLTALRSLWLGNNSIESLPPRIGELRELDWGQRHMTSLCLDGNPLTDPPVDVCKRGIGHIEVYFAKKNGSEKAKQNDLMKR